MGGKGAKNEKIIKYYSRVIRIFYDFFVRHPKLIKNLLLFDRIISNFLLYIPRKLKLAFHGWLLHQVDSQQNKNKKNPIFGYAKQWNGPIMFDIYYMVGFENIIILSQYALISMQQKQTLFDAAFVISNYSNILALDKQIQQKWKQNPQEYERKQYVNLFKLKQ